MADFSVVSKVIITCNKFLSAAVEQEVLELGLKPLRVFPTAVELEASLQDCIRLNLHLRSASQVLYLLKAFRATHPDAVYKQINQLPWTDWLDETSYFSVTGNVTHPSIKNALFANLKVKDAIVDRIRKDLGERPNCGAEKEGAVFHLYWKDDEAELFFDTTGQTLSKHGYRKIPGAAPMLEALASAVILATRWDRRSPFINPMCGSGTLAIEAALLAKRYAPSLFRDHYSFMSVKGFEQSYYDAELYRLESQIDDTAHPIIIASDISAAAIEQAKVNAQAAGVEDLITFHVGDFEKTPLPAETGGVVIFNPEYGERMGEIKVLEETYKRIGDYLKQCCTGRTGYIFTGNLELSKKVGLKPSKRIPFSNAKIECRLLEYPLYEGSLSQD